MIYPYTHLTTSLGSPQVALSILKGLEEFPRERVDRRKTGPVRLVQDFEIHGKGHPLADLSMTICPYKRGRNAISPAQLPVTTR